MRIAALYDIHGNLPALEAILEEISDLQVDRIVVGGDVVPGPIPQETLDMLFRSSTQIDFIYGNGEVAVLQQLAGEQPRAVPEAFRPIIQWTARQLDRETERTLRGWPLTITIESPSLGKILFCHATPGDENEIFTRLTPDERLRSIFADIEADVVICGHTHMQFDRQVGELRVANAGSVGMPFGKPGAHWLLLGDDLEFRRCSYDGEAAAVRIRAGNYPQAEQFATNNILHPPSEEQMLEMFHKAESSI